MLIVGRNLSQILLVMSIILSVGKPLWPTRLKKLEINFLKKPKKANGLWKKRKNKPKKVRLEKKLEMLKNIWVRRHKMRNNLLDKKLKMRNNLLDKKLKLQNNI